jgi:hypothetical protein
MSSLGFCNLDEAFNTSSKLKKKGRGRYSKVDSDIDDNKIDDSLMEKILGRGRELEGNSEPGESRPKMSTDMDYINSLAETYDKNSLFVKNREKELLSESNRDLEPNKMQRDENLKSKTEMEEMRMHILELSNVVKDLANTMKPSHVEPVKEPVKEVERDSLEKIREGYTNYNIDSNIVNKFKSKITFDNDQFNELLLYVFTGIFLLILIDYIYNLGKKAF